MVLSVYNKKGGVGKTALAASLHIDLNMRLISNDDSVIDKLWSDTALIVPSKKLAFQDNTIYDFGGFAEKAILDIITKSTLIIVPIKASINSIQRSLNTINELLDYNENIIAVITQWSKQQDYDEVQKALESHFDDIEIFSLKQSQMYETVFQSGLSPLQLITNKEYFWAKNSYKNAIDEYTKLIERIKNGKTQN